MSYVKQNFIDGNVLTAAELNHIETGIVELEKKIDTGSSGGTQSNHAQNDSTASDYIKNRTHYKGFGVIMPATDITTVDDGGFIAYEYESEDIVAGDNGDNYTVVWNGTRYNCTAIAEDDGCVIGNGIIMLDMIIAIYESFGMTVSSREEFVTEIAPEMAILNNDTGEPFYMTLFNGGLMIGTATAGTYNCKIEGTVFHKLDVRYIPPIEAEVDVATDFEGDNSRPISAGYVQELIGDVEALLKSI